jgi:hypothetical protein
MQFASASLRCLSLWLICFGQFFISSMFESAVLNLFILWTSWSDLKLLQYRAVKQSIQNIRSESSRDSFLNPSSSCQHTGWSILPQVVKLQSGIRFAATSNQNTEQFLIFSHEIFRLINLRFLFIQFRGGAVPSRQSDKWLLINTFHKNLFHSHLMCR